MSAFSAKMIAFVVLLAGLGGLSLPGKIAVTATVEAAGGGGALWTAIEARLAAQGFAVERRRGAVLFPHLVAERPDCVLVIARLPVEDARDAGFARAAARMRGRARYFYDGVVSKAPPLWRPRRDYLLGRALGPLGLWPSRPPRLGAIEAGQCDDAAAGLANFSRRT